MEKKVGINQRISINVMEMAIRAALDGCFTPGYAADLASGEYHGENRINKARSIIGKLTLRNPLFQYIQEHKQEYHTAIKKPQLYFGCGFYLTTQTKRISRRLSRLSLLWLRFHDTSAGDAYAPSGG